MIRMVLVVGTPGAGKSVLLHRLARWLGAVPAPPGSGGNPGLTAYALETGLAPLSRTALLLEAPSLSDAISRDPGERRLQAWALRRLVGAPVVLHVVDAARAGEWAAAGLADGDRILARLGQQRRGYALVAAQMDRPWAETGLEVIRQVLAPPVVVPTAAARDQGMGLLRAFIRRYI